MLWISHSRIPCVISLALTMTKLRKDHVQVQVPPLFRVDIALIAVFGYRLTGCLGHVVVDE